MQKDPWTWGASSMALAHNAILRAFNSIYLQAPHIPDSEKPAFVGYATSWYRFVTGHHEAEEEEFFPNICKLLKDEHLFDKSVEEHRKPIAASGCTESQALIITQMHFWTASPDTTPTSRPFNPRPTSPLQR
jgi:hypothetical protein